MAGDTETAWPEYEIPAGALADDAAPAAPETPSTPPAAASPPPATSTPPPAAGAPGNTESPASPNPPPSELFPKYRLDEANEKTRLAIARAETAERELARLRTLPAQPQGVPPQPAQPPAPPIDPEVAAKNAEIRARMLEVFPEFKALERLVKLADKGELIEGSVDAIQGYREAVSLYYDNFAKTQVDGLESLAATALLGDGKKAEDLSEAAREQIGFAFFSWLKKDPSRAERFDRLDPNLVGEFWPAYKAAVFDPVRRVESAAALHAVEHRQPVPIGGSTTAPMTPAPPKPAVPTDEDAIHAAAWKEVVASRG